VAASALLLGTLSCVAMARGSYQTAAIADENSNLKVAPVSAH
jgi:hypothetical protein